MREDTATKLVGTTLEVLAPYLPYGIQIQTHWKDGPRTGSLSSLNYDQSCVGVKLHGQDELQTLLVFDLCLPVLRPFAALVEPLPDGTVPALALAAIAVPEVRCVRAEILNAGFGQYHCACFGEQGQQYYAIHRNNFESVRGSKVKNRLDGDLTDYLRRNHFALPVNGHPLIEGVDYIAKSSGVPPIEKEAAS